MSEYQCKCTYCGKVFINANKRCVTCGDCIGALVDKAQPATPTESAGDMDAVVEAIDEAIYDEASMQQMADAAISALRARGVSREAVAIADDQANHNLMLRDELGERFNALREDHDRDLAEMRRFQGEHIRISQEIARLRAALERIVAVDGHLVSDDLITCRELAREALTASTTKTEAEGKSI